MESRTTEELDLCPCKGKGPALRERFRVCIGDGDASVFDLASVVVVVMNETQLFQDWHPLSCKGFVVSVEESTEGGAGAKISYGAP